MKRIMYTLDKNMVAAVLTEWDRRFREAPGEFLSPAEHLLFSNPETYGEDSAPYFLTILESLFPQVQA